MELASSGPSAATQPEGTPRRALKGIGQLSLTSRHTRPAKLVLHRTINTIITSHLRPTVQVPELHCKRLVIDVTPVHVPRPGATSHSLSTPVLCQQAIPARPALLAVRVYVCVVKVLSLSASVCENVLVQTATKHRLMKCSNTVSPASV